MKFSIDRSALLIALQHIHSVVERRNTIPILSNVLIEAKEDGVYLTSTDMDITVIEKVDLGESEVTQLGTTTTSAQILYDIVRKLPDNIKVEFLSEKNDRLGIKASSSSFALNCLPSEDFPSIAQEDFKHSFNIDALDLVRLIDKSSFAMSLEETRYYLNGIYLHAIKEDNVEKMRTVATDGHRLSRVDINLPQGAEGIPGVIIPRKTILEIRKILEDHTGNVSLSISETKIKLSFNNVVLTSKLLDGTFPDYSRVIPEHNDKLVTISNQAISEAVDRVSTVSTDKTRAIKININKGSVVISATNPDKGSASEHLDVDYNGDEVEIGFNSKYVLDVARQIKGNEILIKLSDSVSPTLVYDKDDKEVLFVLMPMRV
ncbi:MAG TPA: DNA polymerase III subunit beta [Alphaproteobacteria bacterium]|nr:DNA polymerase III subunit beta [Alphaproteobacteria bacterium]